MNVRDVLLSWSAGRGSLPTVLPGLSRNDLAALSFEMGWTNGAEIGVWKGAFSELLCKGNPRLHLLCVDPWQSYPAWQDAKNKPDPDEAQCVIEGAYEKARKRLAKLNCTIVRKFSADAAAEVPDQSLDFAYIDGNHVFDAVLEDLTVWAPKVKRGGIICGHDYGVFSDKPTIKVVEAVNVFTKTHGVDPWFVLGADKSPSFLWEAA